MSEHAAGQKRIVFVTGPSGAGRSSALNVLEDAGFEVIDNLPLRLLPTLLQEADQARPMALGIDARNRDFSTNSVIDLLGRLATREGVVAELLFLDCSTDVLLRRFSETRRRHPMAPADRPAEGIEAEQDLLAPLRARADVLIDTTDLNVHELRAEVEQWFAPGGKRHLAVTVQSFSYKRGLPRSVDMVYDCRFLKNPYWVPSLRALNGTDDAVAAHVASDPRYADFAQQVLDLSLLILPACREEGKSHFSIAFGCTGGQHRSVTLAEAHALRLAQAGWQVSIRHREIAARQREGGSTA
ncbi:RNase adapter RapZ [Sulfitobacter albidus]|uniref:RNase adapter RapZ n=1 Tax=Sulfitobacter albidus TaxID=2829501 RepID=A0A975PLJ1_9RHOB|nr:RNase adapter RapZ [Sulfitobacter albidus]QUJ75739.1 RNase adapter RapZ [Sulfitobacter albidus]